MKYRTIVADPPWALDDYGRRTPSGKWDQRYTDAKPIPYPRMAVDAIAALPVAALAEADAHLYLWTVNAFVADAYRIAAAWGFRPSTLLTWCKAPMGLGMGGTFANTTEFVLFCRRGTLPALQRMDTTWWLWRRGAHSAKPEAFTDLVEQVSPGPYVELFARRHRLGWDVHGFESANTAQWSEAANG